MGTTDKVKPWYKSKTMVFNFVMAALTAAELNFAMLQPALGADVYGILNFTLVVGNVILRMVTTGPVSLNAQ